MTLAGEEWRPRILTVGEPFWTKGGTRIYVRGFLEASHTKHSRRGIERASGFNHGADGIKIFAGSIERDGVLIMPLDMARAMVAEAHRKPRDPQPATPQELAQRRKEVLAERVEKLSRVRVLEAIRKQLPAFSPGPTWRWSPLTLPALGP